MYSSVANKREDLIVGVRILKNLINRGSKDSLDRKSLGIKVSARGGGGKIGESLSKDKVRYIQFWFLRAQVISLILKAAPTVVASNVPFRSVGFSLLQIVRSKLGPARKPVLKIPKSLPFQTAAIPCVSKPFYPCV